MLPVEKAAEEARQTRPLVTSLFLMKPFGLLIGFSGVGMYGAQSVSQGRGSLAGIQTHLTIYGMEAYCTRIMHPDLP